MSDPGAAAARWAAGVSAEGLPGGLTPEDPLLVVLVDDQRLVLLNKLQPDVVYTISTAMNGLGESHGSNCTPRGWHEVVDRIGLNEPPGRVFLSRVPIDDVVPETSWRNADSPDDRILTRILRLRGLEPGINLGKLVDTYERFIYLHGTNHEEQLGRPVSHGCIRMANRDIIDLADRLGDRRAGCWIGVR